MTDFPVGEKSPGSATSTLAATRCDLLLPKIVYLSQDEWEATGCRCIRRSGHEGSCACECWIDNGKVVDEEAHAYLVATSGKGSS